MSFGDDEEILQDFLVEAGEIIEQLSEQLVDLEQSPNDKDLLNAIFRGFHTVKGGAGFLQLTAMVDCCHVTENLFDILRNGQREVTAELMDVVLRALDTVNAQFNELSSGQEPTPADPELIKQLEVLVSGGDLDGAASAPAAPDETQEPVEESNRESDNALEITDDEFEGFLDAISDGSKEKPAQPKQDATPSSSDDITDDEFENLLDELHGKGKGPQAQDTPQKAKTNTTESKSNTSSGSSTASGDDITEEEFEELLDKLHGSGKGPSKTDSDISVSGEIKDAGSSAPVPAASSGELITDDEFEDLLDQLHGKGKGPVTDAEKPAKTKSSTPIPPSDPAPKPAPAKQVKPASPQPVESSKPAAPAAKPAAQQAQAGETTVRVDTQRLDDIMNMVGELVLVRNRLVRLGLETSDEAIQKAVANLDVVTGDLQTAVMKTRMQPIKKVFGRFPRVVRDLARNLKKEINLELQGEETDLDKNLVEALADPLVHLVRNSVDHGIELPYEREKVGKSRSGTIVLAAEQEGDHILLSIADDGGGMNPDKLREKAVEKGILDSDAAQRLTDVEAFNLIFAPGFSTKTEISDVSGRGVGMDVVKTKITQLNGTIEIDSKVGAGTEIIIKVPLTLAIMPTLMIQLVEQTFALPLASVNEIFHMDLGKSNIVDGQECITIRDKAIPIFYLKNWLVKGYLPAPEEVLVKDEPREGHVVIVTVGTQRVGFVVDQLIGQEEVVIKPLGKMLQGTAGMAGATITGDGTIALILDVPSMLKHYVGGT